MTESRIGTIETTVYQLRQEGVTLDSDIAAVQVDYDEQSSQIEGSEWRVVRVYHGSKGSTEFVESDADQNTKGALQSYVSGPTFLDKLRPGRKEEAKDARDFTVSIGLRSKLADPEDYETDTAVTAALIAEYAYLTGKNANPTRKAELEAIFEWQQIVNQEYRDYKTEIDNTLNRQDLNSITFDYTPAP